MLFGATLPYPARSGLTLRSLAIARALSVTHDLGVFALTAQEVIAPPDEAIVAWRVSRHFVGQAREHIRSSLQWLREPTGHPSDSWYSEAVLTELTRLIGELGARLVVLDSLWFHRYIAPLQALGCRVVLNAHGIEGSLQQQLAARHPTALMRTLSDRTRMVEAGAFAAADEVWVCSAHDVRLASELYERCAPLAVVPNAVDLDVYPRSSASDEYFRIIFTAHFGYPPNVTASRRLLEGIFPQLAERLPRARLALVGHQPTDQMSLAALRDQRIEVTGSVDDVGVHLRRANAAAVPLTAGHGTRLKVLEAFATGLPVVSTAKGVEGIDAVAGQHYLAAETDHEFVAALERLAGDPELGARLSRRGLELVRSSYSVAVVGERVSALLAAAAA